MKLTVDTDAVDDVEEIFFSFNFIFVKLIEKFFDI